MKETKQKPQMNRRGSLFSTYKDTEGPQRRGTLMLLFGGQDEEQGAVRRKSIFNNIHEENKNEDKDDLVGQGGCACVVS